MMKKTILMLTAGWLAAWSAGCASVVMSKAARGESSLSEQLNRDGSRDDRMLIWSAYLSIETDQVEKAANRAAAIAEVADGFVESKSEGEEHYARMTIRVPSAVLPAVIKELEALGKVVHRQVSAEDVTEQYIDLDAKLKNRIALRDRLRSLLDKAVDVKDILAIEKELNRVQGEIDSMTGRLKAMQGQVDLATIELRIERGKILGPLGYTVKALWWGVSKLFVIRN